MGCTCTATAPRTCAFCQRLFDGLTRAYEKIIAASGVDALLENGTTIRFRPPAVYSPAETHKPWLDRRGKGSGGRR